MYTHTPIHTRTPIPTHTRTPIPTHTDTDSHVKFSAKSGTKCRLRGGEGAECFMRGRTEGVLRLKFSRTLASFTACNKNIKPELQIERWDMQRYDTLALNSLLTA